MEQVRDGSRFRDIMHQSIYSSVQFEGKQARFSHGYGCRELKRFLGNLKKSYKSDRIKDGRFGAYMQVNIQNDGPVTIIIDSKKDSKSNETE